MPNQRANQICHQSIQLVKHSPRMRATVSFVLRITRTETGQKGDGIQSPMLICLSPLYFLSSLFATQLLALNTSAINHQQSPP